MNVVFIHIPKAGGLAIEEILGLTSLRNHHRVRNSFKQEGQVSFGHLNYPKLVRTGMVSREFDKSAFKFCFCRNPYDRAVSHWAYTRRKHPDIIPESTTFVEFTRKLYISNFRPQSTWLEQVHVHFIGRFENFTEDLMKVARLTNKKSIELKVKNSSEHPPYRDCYCPESKERVERFYQVDFERFGYEYDNFL